MTILFTEEEPEYIAVNEFGWKIKSGAPTDVKERLQEKLDILTRKEKKQNDRKT